MTSDDFMMHYDAEILHCYVLAVNCLVINKTFHHERHEQVLRSVIRIFKWTKLLFVVTIGAHWQIPEWVDSLTLTTTALLTPLPIQALKYLAAGTRLGRWKQGITKHSEQNTTQAWQKGLLSHYKINTQIYENRPIHTESVNEKRGILINMQTFHFSSNTI